VFLLLINYVFLEIVNFFEIEEHLFKKNVKNLKKYSEIKKI